MPICKNGHEIDLIERCPICGQPIDYYASLFELTEFPKLQYKLNDTIIFVGIQPYKLPNSLFIGIDEKEKIEKDKIILELISGGTWREYYDQYKEKLGKIFDLLGINNAKRKIIILDSINPLSPLVVSLINSNAIFIIILPAENEPLIHLDTAYATVSEAMKKKEPIIPVMRTLIEKFRGFYYDFGISYGIEGFMRMITYFYENYDKLYNFFKISIKFNLKPIFPFSYIIGGTMLVFKDMESVFDLIGVQKTIDFDISNVNTLFLICISPKELKEQIEKQYKLFVLKKFKNIIYNDMIYIENKTAKVVNDIFNLIMFYGISEIGTLDYLSKAHELIIKKVVQNA